ncbi:unnamed protein product, partial [Laminaria digitata]
AELVSDAFYGVLYFSAPTSTTRVASDAEFAELCGAKRLNTSQLVTLFPVVPSGINVQTPTRYDTAVKILQAPPHQLSHLSSTTTAVPFCHTITQQHHKH